LIHLTAHRRCDEVDGDRRELIYGEREKAKERSEIAGTLNTRILPQDVVKPCMSSCADKLK